MTTIPAHFPLRFMFCIALLSPFKQPPTVFFGCASLLLLSEQNYFFLSGVTKRLLCGLQSRVRGKKERKKKNTCCCSERCLIACLSNFNLKVFQFQVKPRRTRRKSERLLPCVRKRRKRKLSPFLPTSITKTKSPESSLYTNKKLMSACG